MSLAEEVSGKAIGLRKHGGDLHALREVVESWSRRLFWDQDPDTKIATLAEALENNPTFQRDLADALAWNKPKSDSPELTMLAVDAARGKKPKPLQELFGKDLDWEAWKRNPDLRSLQVLFDNNAVVRNAFARVVDAYPGRSHIKEIATASIIEIQTHGPRAATVQTALEQHMLNWNSFEHGQQDEQFGAAISKEYDFREQVARATNFKSREALELAVYAIDMWKSVPLRFSRQKTRSELLNKLGESPEGMRVRQILQDSATQEPDELGWENMLSQIRELFAQEPMASCALWEATEWPQPFALVLREELRQIERSRELKHLDDEQQDRQLANKALDASDLAAHKMLFGVALSGGGIRSATFNLGVLQMLSSIGLLEKVDYLSTVSGGGYIGSWFAAWSCKNGALSFEDFLKKIKQLLPPKYPDPRDDSQQPIRFLREFSNYLTPRLGSFSFDTWTMAAVFSRNVILNQAVLISILGTILLIPRLFLFPMKMNWPDSWMWMGASLTLLFSVFFMSLNMRKAVAATFETPSRFTKWLGARLPSFLYEPVWVQILVIGNMFAAVYLGSVWFWRHILELDEEWLLSRAFVFAAVLSLLLSGLGGFVQQFRKRQSGSELWFVVLVMVTVLSAGASVGLLHFYIYLLRQLCASPSGVCHAEVWGPVMLLAVLLVPGTLQVGLMGVDYPDPGREWLGRFRAICSVYVTYWILWMSAAIYGPFLVLTATGPTIKGVRVWISGLTLGWVTSTIVGLYAGNSKETGKDKDGNPTISWFQILAKLGPPVFIVGLVLWIATLEELLIAHGQVSPFSLSTLIQDHWTLLQPWPLWDRSGWIVDRTGWLFVSLAVAGFILAWRVDINEFSMHHFYKNRLVRCYLGASNEDRKPDPFTGFDGKDDFSLSQLQAIVPEKAIPYLGPYPILNATLNLSVGKQLAWQERKGASFIFTPCFSGFDVQGWAKSTGSMSGRMQTKKTRFWSKETLRPFGYRKTENYTQAGGPLLGTAMSISGAAANPNQGYNTSPAVSFLMTMFDVRLGWWLGNPRRDSSSMLSSPRFGLAALVSELLGSTDDETRFVNLTDGGHFDNMGLYELVRRRCSFIVLCDAEQDSDYKFEGLGSAIRKCRVDFGALIEIDTIRMKPAGNGKASESHCAVGKITYMDGSEGTLFYIKSSLTGDEPEDVTQYHATQVKFPHESTADQWFGESQFESYRALGFHATYHSINPAKRWLEGNDQHLDVSGFFRALTDYWYPVNPSLKDTASKHTATLSDLFERIRTDPSLQALGAQLFPGGFTTTRGGQRNATAEFYLGMCVIQLMEDLFVDFQLDSKKWFHDPRIGGWRFLFQRWKNVPAVSSAWASERDTFRKDFQLFWNSL